VTKTIQQKCHNNGATVTTDMNTFSHDRFVVIIVFMTWNIVYVFELVGCAYLTCCNCYVPSFRFVLKYCICCTHSWYFAYNADVLLIMKMSRLGMSTNSLRLTDDVVDRSWNI